MRYIGFVIFCSHISYLLATPLPDTNVQIQNYDGPIFLHTPKLNCCPLCNSVLSSPLNENELEKSNENNSDNYPTKAVYGNNLASENNHGKDIYENQNEDKVPNVNMVIYGNSYTGRGTSENSGIHTDSVKLGGNTYSGSVNDKNRCSETGYFENSYNSAPPKTNTGANTANNLSGARVSGSPSGISRKGTRDSGSNHIVGNNYTKTGPTRNYNNGEENTSTDCARNYIPVSSGNTQTFAPGNYNTYTPIVTGTECTCVTKPLSSYLPINTAAENGCTCFRVPMAVCNQAYCPEDDTILVPQKFSYSLILDGEVAPSVCQNGQYECKCYCCY